MRKDSFPLENKFQLAKDVIYEAGNFIKERMAGDFAIEEKSRFDDLVTDLDRDVQNLMIQKIGDRYPQDDFLGEENGVVSDISKGNVWVLDPIDGTVNFIAQKHDFAVMIAYYEEGVGQFGLIYDVMADKLYSGGGLFPVTVNGKELISFEDKPFNRSLIGVNSGMCIQNYRGIADFGQQTLGIRGIGSAGISISRVLEGRFLAYFTHISPWDYAAGSIMGEKLGYTIRDFDGHSPDYKTRQELMFVPKAKLSEILHHLK